MSSVTELLEQIPILKTAFEEQQAAIRSVWKHAEEVLRVDETIPKQFQITLDPIPDSVLSFQNNMFSSLLLGVLYPLGISPERRMLYGKLNHLFRAVVTSTDNLLDREDKMTFPVRMPGNGSVMRQIIVILLSDRIVYRLLAEAQANGVLSQDEARRLSDETLRVLLPSAAEEAFEEGGLREWPKPEFVLDQLHPLKIGIFFNIPFVGPEKIERNVDRNKIKKLKASMRDFAIGCQMLDDIRDLSRDFIERRANYVVAQIVHGPNGTDGLKRLEEQTKDDDLDKRLDRAFASETSTTFRSATSRIGQALGELDGMGLGGFATVARTFTAMLIQRLDLAHLNDKENAFQ
jgi:hypothetical protein